MICLFSAVWESADYCGVVPLISEGSAYVVIEGQGRTKENNSDKGGQEKKRRKLLDKVVDGTLSLANMAKVQIGLRVDEELLAVVDELALRTGESRTDVLLAALERGLYEEQRFVAAEDVPVLRNVVEVLQKAGVDRVVAKMLGQTIDPRKVRVAEHIRAERRKGRRGVVSKGAES